ncbi:bifunctional nuclease family protein [Oscillatoria amoena NRMC-F 0135]|nr:bifunctional nuclease family protein [Oscillatoria laete-virens]MDL5049127.1 bifunctional nuclease family protein [Oscillatoria amoena NRMC-F 0135]MDL5052208.1 bifunctional nuclease family protein [Oscillatoria laete-virens NRMC-F 0139]
MGILKKSKALAANSGEGFNQGIVNKDVVEIHLKKLYRVPQGYAVFMGNEDKTFIIYVDAGVGSAIEMFQQHLPKERPLTHDLIVSVMTGLGAGLERALIHSIQGNTFYARLFIKCENELGKKMIEIDCRPSDALALAVHYKAKIYCRKTVFQSVEDTTEILEKIESQSEGGEDAGLGGVAD